MNNNEKPSGLFERRVEFIGNKENGRGKDLSTLIKFCEDWRRNSGVLIIEGDGGVGKTRLLQEAYNRLQNHERCVVLPSIIDFDDPNYSFVQNVLKVVTSFLEGDEGNNPYIREYSDSLERFKQDERGGGLLPTALEERRELWVDKWHQAIDYALGKRTLVFFLDTVETLTDYQQQAIEKELIAPSIKKICFVIAGREIAKHGYQQQATEKKLTSSIVDFCCVIAGYKTPLSSFFKLGAFDNNDCILYLNKKCEKEGIRSLGRDQQSHRQNQEKIIRLAEGNLVLIDLSIMILRREYNVDFLTQCNDNETFKKALITTYLADDTIHRIIRILSYCYPMNLSMLDEFLYPGDKKEFVFDYLKDMAFVKLLPNGFIRLHDVMREIIENYEAEDWVLRSKKLTNSEIFSRLLAKEIEKLHGKSNESLVWFIRVQKMKHNIFIAKEKKEDPVYFKHPKEEEVNEKKENESRRETLNKDTNLSLKELFELCEMSNELGDVARELMMEEAENALGKDYSEPAWTDLLIQHKVRLHEYKDLDLQATKLSSGQIKTNNEGGQKLHETAFHLWKINYDQGKLHEAIACLEKLANLPNDPNAFRKHNLMGLVYQDLGEFKKAIEAHETALQKIIIAGPENVSKTDVAHVHNALSYAYALNRNIDQSYAANQHAMTLYDQDGNDYGKGQCLSTRGRSRIEFNRADSAIRNLNRALSGYERTMTLRERSRIYLGLAHALLLKENLNAASSWLEKVTSKELENSRLLALYHQLSGCLYYREGTKIRHEVLAEGDWLNKYKNNLYQNYLINLHRSRNCFAKAVVANQRMKSDFYMIYSTAGVVRTMIDELITLTEDAGDQNTASTLHAKIKGEEATLEALLKDHVDYNTAWSPPLLWKQFADYYLIANDEERALDYYKKAFPLIAEKRIHEPFSIMGQLVKTEEHILHYLNHRDKNDAVINRVAKNLLDDWRKRYPLKFPEVSQTLANWSTGCFKEWGGSSGPLF